MKEKLKKYLFVIPTFLVLILMVLLPILFSMIYTNKIKSLPLEYVTLGLAFISVVFFIIAIAQTIYCMINVYRNKNFKENEKLIWYILLFILNIFIMPCYYYKYILNVEKSKNEKLIYVISILILCVLSIITSMYSIILYNNYINQMKEVERAKAAVTTIISSNDNTFDMTFKLGWKKTPMSDYDLYVKQDNKNLITGAFIYDITNYEEKTATAVLNKQADFVKNTRKDIKIFKEESVRTYNNKTIDTLELSGKSDDSSDCIYKLSTITFEGNATNIIYVIQVSLKKNYGKNNNELIEILNSINLK